jgi:hypothetical protein
MMVPLRAALSIVLLATGGSAPEGTLSRDAAASQLLALHADVLAAHLAGDAPALVSRESDDYVVGNRGEITFPSLEARTRQFTKYLGATRFSEYRDLVEPVVQVSPDGRLGWVIAQVGARGVQEQGDGTSQRVEFVCAWIELYESREGRWFRVGNVSTFRPDSTSR